MIKQERKTLHIIKKYFGHSEMIFLDTDNRVLVCDNIRVPFPYHDMSGIICSLSKKDILFVYDHPFETYFTLTYDGYNHFKILLDNFKTAFLTKWLPGFISGIATSVAVNMIIKSIPHILH